MQSKNVEWLTENERGPQLSSARELKAKQKLKLNVRSALKKQADEHKS